MCEQTISRIGSCNQWVYLQNSLNYLFIFRGRAATLMPCDILLCTDYVLEHVN